MSDLLSNFGESTKKFVAPIIVAVGLQTGCATAEKKPEAFRICEQEAETKFEASQKAAGEKKKEAPGGGSGSLWDQAKNAGRVAGGVGGAALGYVTGIGVAGGAFLGASVGGIGAQEKKDELFKECMDRRYAGSGTPKSGYEQRNTVPVDVKTPPKKARSKRADAATGPSFDAN